MSFIVVAHKSALIGFFFKRLAENSARTSVAALPRIDGFEICGAPQISNMNFASIHHANRIVWAGPIDPMDIALVDEGSDQSFFLLFCLASRQCQKENEPSASALLQFARGPARQHRSFPNIPCRSSQRIGCHCKRRCYGLKNRFEDDNRRKVHARR